MNYIEIILRGYTNENDRKFLDKYFIREFRNAEKENYDLTVFFEGLKTGYETLINECQKQLFKRKHDLYRMKTGAENDTLEYVKNELASISLENYTINLVHFTNNKFTGHLSYNEVEFIGNEMAKAYKVLSQTEAPQQNNNKNPDKVIKHPKHDPNLWNVQCFDLFKYIFDEYYKGNKRQLTNIWFYLKEYHNAKYVLKATKKDYVKFIKIKYNIPITNFDKAQIKYDDKDYGTMNEHRKNFESNLK